MGEQHNGAQPAPVTTIVCPHCNGMIGLGAGQGGPDGAGPPEADGAERGGGNDGTDAGKRVEQWLVSVIGRGLTRVIGERGTVPRWIIIIGVLVMVLVLGGIMLVGGSAPVAEQEPAPANAISQAEGMEQNGDAVLPAAVAGDAAGTEAAVAEAAIIAMLRAYNTAETEAAETLEFAIIAPFLDPDGPFYAERQTAMQERVIALRPHSTILQEWVLGTITIRDNEATVVTQEVWSNQERGAVAPVIARVRVTYTLRFDAGEETWMIVSSSYSDA